MKNTTVTLKEEFKNSKTVIEEAIEILRSCKLDDKQVTIKKRETRRKRTQTIIQLARYLHEVKLIPKTMVSEELSRLIPKDVLSRRYILLLLPNEYKNPNMQPSEQTLIKRSVKRVNAELRPEEKTALYNSQVVIIPKTKVQAVIEASFHCKNNVVLILSKETRRPIAIYPDINSNQYPIRVEALLG